MGMEKTLVIGIGNTGRADDGLGWAFLDKLMEDDRFEVTYRYQLQVEDAELISRYDRVWFIDASHRAYENGFECKVLQPESQHSYTTHELHPATVLHLSQDLYQKSPESYLLEISGEDWELGHKMSIPASSRLEKAFEYFLQCQILIPDMF